MMVGEDSPPAAHAYWRRGMQVQPAALVSSTESTAVMKAEAFHGIGDIRLDMNKRKMANSHRGKGPGNRGLCRIRAP